MGAGTPRWTSPQGTLHKLESDDFEILIDQSEPIGGYFNGSQSILPDVFRNTYSILNSQYGTGTCFGVGTTVTSFDCGETLSQPFFNGINSEVHTAFDSVMERLQEGAIEAAVLISDLLITKNGHFLGAPGLVDNSDTRDLLLSGLNSRQLDLALVGIPLPYHGILRDGDRWWFNDCYDRYEKLATPASRPLYVLIIGRRSGNANTVDEIASDLERVINRLDGSIQVIRQTFSSTISTPDIKWGETEPQRSLHFEQNPGSYRCRFKRGSATSKAPGTFPPCTSAVTIIPSSTKWIEITKDLKLRIHCDTANNAANSRLEITRHCPNYSAKFDVWDSATCRPASTYGLGYLIDVLHPDYYRAQSNPFVMRQR